MSRPAAQTTCVKKLRRALFAMPLDERRVGGGVDHVVEGVVRRAPSSPTSAPSCVPSRARRRSSSVSSRSAVSAVVERREPLGGRSAASRARWRGSRARRGRGTPRAAPRARASARVRRGSGRTRRARAQRAGAAPRGSGVRETWYCSESCSWRSTVPGAISPETIASSSASARSSAFVPTVAMPLSVGRSAGRRRDRVGAVVDPHRDERQLALARSSPRSRGRAAPRRSPRPGRRGVRSSSTSSAVRPVLGEGGDQPGAVGVPRSAQRSTSRPPLSGWRRTAPPRSSPSARAWSSAPPETASITWSK